MRFGKRSLIWLALLLPVFSFSQCPSQLVDGKIQYTNNAGKWIFAAYANNIIKVTFRPTDYRNNEQVSDAVITKPIKIQGLISRYELSGGCTISGKNLSIRAYPDSVIFGNGQVVLTGSHHSEDYRGFRFRLKNNEKIFGAGERAVPLNRRGYKLNLYNNPSYGYGMGTENLNYSVPFITSSNNYGLFFDNPSKGYLDIGKTNADVLEYGAVSGELNFYIIPGNSYAEILKSYHKLTGTQPMPPRWAFGNFLSRFGYTSEAEIKDIMHKMRENEIPYDAVIFDLFWFGDSIKGTMGNLDWVNKKAWPNPAKMINDFSNEGTETILITEPFVLKSSLNYDVSKRYHAVDSTGKPFMLTNFYFGNGGLVDIFRNDSKDWFWSKYKTQMDKGVEAWWGDLGEPETHPAGIYHNLRDQGFKRLFKAEEVHNIYGHYWTKMLFDKYAKEYPNKRLFSLNRSGFAGTQRYGIFPWTGDVSRGWNGLQAQLPVLLGMSMSGIPYVHSDAGGYAGGGNDPELYIRWLQFAQYTPIFRPHGTELSEVGQTGGNYPSEPALFDEPYRTIAKDIIIDRYKMLPYNYTLAYEQAKDGKPLIRPMYYQYSHDTNCYRAQDQYMWGDAFLVAPVLQKGVIDRRLYLPTGNWFNWNTYKMIEGGKWINENVEDFKLPVFVKEGSFVPKYRSTRNNTKDIDRSLMSLIYVPSLRPSSYTMYDDDGESKNALSSKKYELITFSSMGKKERSLTLNITSNNGAYKGKPLQRKILLTITGIDKMPTSILLNGVKMKLPIPGSEPGMVDADKEVVLVNDVHLLLVPVVFRDKPVKVEIRW